VDAKAKWLIAGIVVMVLVGVVLSALVAFSVH